MTELKPTKYARLRTTKGEVLFRKDRIISVELIQMDNLGDLRVFVVMQSDIANSRREFYYVPNMEAYDDFLGEVYDA